MQEQCVWQVNRPVKPNQLYSRPPPPKDMAIILIIYGTISISYSRYGGGVFNNFDINNPPTENLHLIPWGQFPAACGVTNKIVRVIPRCLRRGGSSGIKFAPFPEDRSSRNWTPDCKPSYFCCRSQRFIGIEMQMIARLGCCMCH